ncbi:MAG: hypothetical protein NXY57DRAFT_789244 [Lentinula lateritia]|uniref:BZIP domain-containing protein n=1 Tax=Lentinula lateritia TaxID=40482 RepID=A0ABQ8V2V8_9AGAR|nr:MAG: hypothetical protein NXY57DRAFT_789244 [Lentinula lateritia]KAJ4468017.1 hypothetical protein C8R41DRAFT_43674 [Lentinula lateritia]
MLTSHIYGLNVIEPGHLDSSSQNLLSGPFPDLSLWTHLPFEIEDGPVSAVTNDSGLGQLTEEDEKGGNDVAAAIHNGHINVVAGMAVNNEYLSQGQPSPPSLDIDSLISSIGINPLVLTEQSQPAQRAIAPVLLAMNVAKLLPPIVPQPKDVRLPHPQSTKSTIPLAKRQRSRKLSVGESSQSMYMPTPLTTAEDKRQRNTAASARFRLKKKEREIALDKQTKELEARVNELEKRCEGLRRENGWLKGLVVGVTGGVQNSSTGLQPHREEILLV